MAIDDGKSTGRDEYPDIEHIRKEPRPDFSKPVAPKKLPQSLQETLDNEEKLWDILYDGNAPESTDTNLRYAAYATRFRTILTSAHRYVAYTSDIGESFRPVSHPYLVRAAYGISWAYLAGDVAHEGYKAYLRNQRTKFPEKVEGSVQTTGEGKGQPAGTSTTLGAGLTGPTGSASGAEPQGRVVPIEDYRAVMAERAVFQSVASMGLPALTIHSIVKYSGRALKDAANKNVRTWMPIGLGLAAVPFLPFVFDKPVEEAVQWTFHKGFELVGGPSAVSGRPEVKKELRQAESTAGAKKEKEL